MKIAQLGKPQVQRAVRYRPADTSNLARAQDTQSTVLGNETSVKETQNEN